MRYKLIWSETWKIWKQLDTPVRERDGNKFLPAHLELIGAPVPGRLRLVAYFIMGSLAIIFILSVLGQVEIIATANGKLTLSECSKEVKPIENSIARGIIIKEGESVRKGEVLLKLTTLGVKVNTLKTQSSLLQARLGRIRYQILNRLVELNRLPEPELLDELYFQNVPEEEVLRLTSLIKEQLSTWQDQKCQKEPNLDKKRAEQLTILARINRYENVSRVEKNRLDDFRSLLYKQAIAKHAVLEQENKYAEVANELRIYRLQLEQIEDEILSAKEGCRPITQLFKNEILDKLRQATDNVELLTLELERNEEHQRASVIRAPVSGKVQRSKVHIEGGVVTTAEILTVIVPEDDMLEVTTLVQNKDIGFINVGWNAIIKVETLPYTRYDYLVGKVENISLDAIEDQKLGLVLSVIVSVEKNDLSTGGEHIPLSLGMVATAEIKTGI